MPRFDKLSEAKSGDSRARERDCDGIAARRFIANGDAALDRFAGRVSLLRPLDRLANQFEGEQVGG
jgi:hypothetical protein